MQIATKINENESLLMTGYTSLDEICVGLIKFDIDYAIVAREVYMNFFEKLMHYNVKIIGEEVHNIKYYLVGLSGVKREDLDTISMHSLTSSHCRNFLKTFNNIHMSECTSLLGTIQSLNATSGIITTDISCLSYGGIDIIETLSDNYSTSFILLSRDSGLRNTANIHKTSVIFSLQSPGDFNCILSAAKDLCVARIDTMCSGTMLSLDFIENGANSNELFLASLNDKIVYRSSYIVGNIHSCIRDYIDSWILSLDDVSKKTVMSIGIVGYGTFGQFISKRFKSFGHTLYCIDKDDMRQEAADCGCKFYSLYDTDDMIAFFANRLDVIVIAVAIVSFQDVLTMVTSKNLLQNQLIVDVLSVKSHAKSTLLNILPQSVDILCTHPMFGPSSAKHSWKGKNFMFEKVRIRDEVLCNNYLNIFRDSGCQMIEITSELHDEYAAKTQFITHFICRILSRNGYEKTPIDTVTWTNLYNIVQNISNNSNDLFYGLYYYNRSNTEREMERIQMSAGEIYKELMDKDKPI